MATKGRKPKKDKSRCVCGRNLAYPDRVTDNAVYCRCGRRHKKELKEYHPSGRSGNK